MPIDLEGLKASSEILHRILAIPQAADDTGSEAIVGSPVLGFVYVFVHSHSLRRREADLNFWNNRSAIDTVKKKVTLLSPLPGRLPRKTLLLASLDWQDS